MNRNLNAVALANKRLVDENRKLWRENDELRDGAEQTKQLYEALVTQLVINAGGSVTLARCDVAELMRDYSLEAQIDAETGDMTLHVDGAIEAGKWIEHRKRDEKTGIFDLRFECSNCGLWQTYGITPYCPFCGQKMEDVEDGD